MGDPGAWVGWLVGWVGWLVGWLDVGAPNTYKDVGAMYEKGIKERI